jgi:hypothetical protein
MTKQQVLKFVKEHREQLERFKNNFAHGRISRAEQRAYLEAYQYVDPKAQLCFTCGRSAQIMANTMLDFYETAKPKKRKAKTKNK